jgi:hypothetical protein
MVRVLSSSAEAASEAIATADDLNVLRASKNELIENVRCSQRSYCFRLPFYRCNGILKNANDWYKRVLERAHPPPH